MVGASACTHIITDRESNSQKQHGIPVLMRGVSGWVPTEHLATLPPLDLERSREGFLKEVGMGQDQRHIEAF